MRKLAALFGGRERFGGGNPHATLIGDRIEIDLLHAFQGKAGAHFYSDCYRQRRSSGRKAACVSVSSLR